MNPADRLQQWTREHFLQHAESQGQSVITCIMREVSNVHWVVTDVPMDKIYVESVHDAGNISLEDDGGRPIEDVIPAYKLGNKERWLTELKASFAKLEEDHVRLQE